MEKIIKTKNFFRRTFLRYSRSRDVFFFALFVASFLLVPNIHPAAAYDVVKEWINPALYVIFQAFGYLAGVAATMFNYAADATVFNQVMDGEAIYAVWKVIRDFCNIFFIVILLFSAFATIFQLDRYDYKKTVPTLILMALLVNFSFPIARFVIDISNVIMYFFLQNVFQMNTIPELSSALLGGSDIKEILIPKGQDPKSMDTTALIFAIICIFLFAITLLVLAALMVVRMVGLAILVMLSPIGFVGMITPALHKYASEWWDKLFKWAFFGPTSVVFLLIAIRFMQASKGVLTSGSITNGGGSTLAAISYFAIPIVLMWMAILQGEKAASDISSSSIKFGSSWGRKVGGWMKKGAIGTAMYIPRQSGAVGGVKEAWKNRLGWGGKNMRDARERREARIAGYWSSGEGSRADRANRAQNEFVNKKAREIAEENKKNQVSDEKIRKDLKAAADGKDKNDPWVQARGRAAIASMNDREIMNVNDLEGALKVAGNDMDLVASIVRKAPKEMIASSANLSKALESISKSIDTTVNQMTNKTEEQRKAERTRLKEKMLGSLVEKSSGGALGGSADEIKTIMTSFTDNGQVNEELLRALKGKMKKEGQMNAMINYEMEHGTNKVAANATAEEKQKAFEKIFRELKMHEYTGKSLGEQKGLVDQEQFRRHFIEGYRNKEYNATDRQDLHRAGSGAHRGELERELSAIDEERERRRGEDESRRRQNERDREIEERNRRRNGTA